MFFLNLRCLLPCTLERVPPNANDMLIEFRLNVDMCYFPPLAKVHIGLHLQMAEKWLSFQPKAEKLLYRGLAYQLWAAEPSPAGMASATVGLLLR